jgi:hypothetical protein
MTQLVVFDVGARSAFPDGLENLDLTGSLSMEENAVAPAAPAANGVKIYPLDSGAGQTQLVARFATGADQVIARQGGMSSGYITGEYYGSAGVAAITGATSTAPTTSRMCEFMVDVASASFSSIAVEVTTAAAAGTLIRFGIYKDDGSGRPGALVLDCGTVASDVVGLREKAVTVTLTQGAYWLGVVSVNANTTIRTFTGVNKRIPQPRTGTLNATNNGYSVSHVAGAAFPATAGSAGAIVPAALAPRVMLMAA